jgi:hypothetical protein
VAIKYTDSLPVKAETAKPAAAPGTDAGAKASKKTASKTSSNGAFNSWTSFGLALSTAKPDFSSGLNFKQAAGIGVTAAWDINLWKNITLGLETGFSMASSKGDNDSNVTVAAVPLLGRVGYRWPLLNNRLDVFGLIKAGYTVGIGWGEVKVVGSGGSKSYYPTGKGGVAFGADLGATWYFNNLGVFAEFGFDNYGNGVVANDNNYSASISKYMTLGVTFRK